MTSMTGMTGSEASEFCSAPISIEHASNGGLRWHRLGKVASQVNLYEYLPCIVHAASTLRPAGDLSQEIFRRLGANIVILRLSQLAACGFLHFCHCF
jgi:hypothetical protein